MFSVMALKGMMYSVLYNVTILTASAMKLLARILDATTFFPMS